MPMTKAECGQRGGLKTASLYDMRARGKLGGRPRTKTYSELFSGPTANKEKEEGIYRDISSISLKEALALLKIKKGEGLVLG